jgi:adenylosuccinate synthase
MPCTVVVGGFFGDEGKGKIIAYLAMKDKPRIIARGGVGPNAGHTVNYMNKSYFLRMIPSGFIYEDSRLLIGPGVLVNPKVFLEEVKLTKTEKRVGLDKQCAIIEEKHIQQEIQSKYLVEKIGTTKSGVGYCQAERALRIVKLAKDVEELLPYLTDVSLEINEALENGKNVLIEGTQGTFLSLYHGTYPFCTSKDVCASAICSDVGVGPKSVEHVIIVFKAYVTRVGEGPLEGELPRDEVIKRGWLEYGTVTRRERRAAPFNFDLAKKAVRLNSATEAVLTKMDVIYPSCKGVKNFDKLPKEAKDFIEKVENEIRIPVALIGTGPSTYDIIDRRNELD